MFINKPWRWLLVAAFVLMGFYIQETLKLNAHTAIEAGEVAVEAKEKDEKKNRFDAEQPLPDFASITNTLEKKITFFNYFYPLVLLENKKILAERELLLSDKGKNKAKIKQLCEKYSNQCEVIDQAKMRQLLKRVDVIPPALVLAQAAKESGWGSSRFALQANNYFGQWCYSKGCGLVPNSRIEGASHEVRKFSSPQRSVNAYLFNLNTGRAYADLRTLREVDRAKNKAFYGYDLAASLLYYSEQREVYVEELQSFIRYNQLMQYDEEFWDELEEN